MSFIVIVYINDQLFKVVIAFNLLISPNLVKNYFTLYSNLCISSDTIYYKLCNCGKLSDLLLLLFSFGVPSNFNIKFQKSSFNVFVINYQYASFFSLFVCFIDQHLSCLQIKYFFVQSFVVLLQSIKQLIKRLAKQPRKCLIKRPRERLAKRL